MIDDKRYNFTCIRNNSAHTTVLNTKLPRPTLQEDTVYQFFYHQTKNYAAFDQLCKHLNSQTENNIRVKLACLQRLPYLPMLGDRLRKEFHNEKSSYLRNVDYVGQTPPRACQLIPIEWLVAGAFWMGCHKAVPCHVTWFLERAVCLW